MRKTWIITALTLFCCTAIWAEEPQFRVSLLASEISGEGGGNELSNETTQLGYGIGLAYAPVPDYDIELTVNSSDNLLSGNRLSGNVPDVLDAGTNNCWHHNTYTTGTVPPC